MTRRIAVGVLAAGLTACGGNVSSTPGVTEAQLVEFQSVGQGLADAVQTYAVQSSASASQETCQAAQHPYDAAATPLVTRLREQSHAMDQHMASLGWHVESWHGDGQGVGQVGSPPGEGTSPGLEGGVEPGVWSGSG